MPLRYWNQLDVKPSPLARVRARVWREWCFARTVGRRFWWRFVLMLTVLVGGGVLFMRFEPDQHRSLVKASYYTWCLVFGEPPEAFPKSPVLQSMFFVVPVLGLTIIIESIVGLASLVRDRSQCERSWCVIMSKAMSDHIVLVGMGKLGYRTYHLLKRLGQKIVVIERNPQNPFLEDVRRDGTPLLIGDARHEALLEDANVAQARSVILATNDDLANLEIALDARKIAPTIRVVVRMFDQTMADKIRDGFNIHIAMSQSAISAPAFATAAIEPSIMSSMVVGGALVVIQRWIVAEGGPFCDRTVADVLIRNRCSVIERRSDAEMGGLFPPPDTRLRAGDRILVQGPFETLTNLKRSSTARRMSDNETELSTEAL